MADVAVDASVAAVAFVPGVVAADTGAVAVVVAAADTEAVGAAETASEPWVVALHQRRKDSAAEPAHCSLAYSNSMSGDTMAFCLAVALY